MIVVGDTLEVFGFCSIADVRVDVPTIALMLPDAARHCGAFVLADKVVAITMLDAYGIGVDEHDHEGRVITLEYDNFFFITCYTPNSQDELRRLDYRMKWEDDFLAYINGLKKKKPVIFCGDLNVAHQEIDLKNPKTNRRNAGFTDEERGKMTDLLASGYVDSFRYLYPDLKDAYSWWSYRFRAREKNAGWRIDYFIVSDDIKDKITGASIHNEIYGSDHCPVELDIEL